MREFFQCDLDIAGAYPGMAADAEVVSVRGPTPPHHDAALHSSGRCAALLPPPVESLKRGVSSCETTSARTAAALGPALGRAGAAGDMSPTARPASRKPRRFS